MTSPTPLITGTDFITVATKDFDAAIGFYGGVLGLPESKRWGQMPAAEFETGNLTIAVMQSDAFGLEFRANNHPIELRVDDFQAAHDELESRGVEFKGETIDSGFCCQAFFEDPDGQHAGDPPPLRAWSTRTSSRHARLIRQGCRGGARYQRAPTQLATSPG